MISRREKFKTYKNVFDEFTLRNLFKLSSQGYFDVLESPISKGKESNVFSALTKDKKRVILKIYRLETCDFNRMYDYLRSDPRYMQIKKQRRKVIFAWAQREFRNLKKISDIGVRVPKALTFLNNILVMEFIGRNYAAPKVKDSIPGDLKRFSDKTITYMKKLYKNGIVHADLSEFNILNHNQRPVFIDLSQATVKDHSQFNEFLERDIRNICKFFRKKGLDISEEYITKKVKA